MWALFPPATKWVSAAVSMLCAMLCVGGKGGKHVLGVREK